MTGDLMFMILSRSSKNRLGLSGFVKKSARLASLAPAQVRGPSDSSVGC